MIWWNLYRASYKELTSANRHRSRHFVPTINNVSCVETRMYSENYVNSMAADGLVPCIVRPSAAMVLTLYDKQILVLHKEGFQPSAPSEWMRNDRKCSYIFMVSKNNLTHDNSTHHSICQISVFLLFLKFYNLNYNWLNQNHTISVPGCPKGNLKIGKFPNIFSKFCCG